MMKGNVTCIKPNKKVVLSDTIGYFRIVSARDQM